MVQPLSGKILLPVMGGSPQVWSTCVVFFQAVLLLGYLYAHALSTWIPQRWQGSTHVGVLALASATLPLSVDIGGPGTSEPGWWLLQALFSTVGLPFFALSATAPLLQHWFSRSGEPDATDPYFLYATSNAGSLLGLLAYPLVEPFATRSAQTMTWSVGFWVTAVVVAFCTYALRRHSPVTSLERQTTAPAPIAFPQRLLWIALAAVPSALLLGVTQHLATDIVSAPLLWVVPMALYLATYVAAFSRRGFVSARRWGAFAPAAAILVLILSLGDVRYPILLVTLAHLAAFTVLAMMCHTRLAESRPVAASLTGYFVCVSLGGVIGGAAVGLMAPTLFSSVLEYPIAIAAALFLRPHVVEADRSTNGSALRWVWRAGAAVLFIAAYWAVSTFDAHFSATPSSNALVRWLQSFTGDAETAQHMLRMLFAIPAVLLLVISRTTLLFAGTAAGLLVAAAIVRTGGEVLYRERTFFGVHQVTAIQNGDWHVLTHGTTTHGVQAFRGKARVLPTAYYHPSGPFGDLVFTLSGSGRFSDVGVIGLGAGALAGYAGGRTRMDFFEVDDAVIRIAENPAYFTYLTDARARPGAAVRTIAVDGRLGLREMHAASYDLIVVDAFSSDAIPTHLITREAVAEYASRLKPRGVMAFHVSSRFFNLQPVLAAVAADQRLIAYVREDMAIPAERAGEAMRPSVWVVLARNQTDLGQLASSAPRWRRLDQSADIAVWTDEYVNVFGVLGK